MDRYLFAMPDIFGKCWVVRDGETEKVAGLPSLLREGWRPVRETPFVNTNYMLIVLERESSCG